MGDWKGNVKKHSPAAIRGLARDTRAVTPHFEGSVLGSDVEKKDPTNGFNVSAPRSRLLSVAPVGNLAR
jgi:hypothetical protein